MSIWCSLDHIGTIPGWPDEEPNHRGVVMSYASGFSNHYPTTDGTYEQPAAIATASVAPWCTPGWDQEVDDLDYPQAGEWLRLDVASWEYDWASGGVPTGKREGATVVLDEAAARSLAADLLAWADRPLLKPK